MAAYINIRPFSEADWPAVWEIMEPVIRAGDTYPYAMQYNLVVETNEPSVHLWQKWDSK